ncbi:MAG: gamma-glutamylcyclotransferase [Albidovulum sp.]
MMWVFGYGSLIFNPGFEYHERVTATLEDFHRSFCIRSIHARGTSETPGLGLALTASSGRFCTGVAFSVAPQNTESVLDYLRAREMVNDVYVETRLEITLADNRRVRALTYVANTEHAQFVTGLSLEEQARLIARAAGDRGPNCEYLYNAVEHLEALGVHDPQLTELVQRVHSLEKSAPLEG